MKGELVHRAEHWGAELAFTEHFWEQGPMHSCCLLFWSDWSGSEAPQQAHWAEVAMWGWGGGLGSREKETTKDMFVPRGIRLQGWGSPSPALFHGLHSSGQANSKHICCCCSHHTAFGTSFTAFLNTLYSYLVLLLDLCWLCFTLNVSSSYWSSISFIFHQYLFPYDSLSSSHQFLFLNHWLRLYIFYHLPFSLSVCLFVWLFYATNTCG